MVFFASSPEPSSLGVYTKAAGVAVLGATLPASANRGERSGRLTVAKSTRKPKTRNDGSRVSGNCTTQGLNREASTSGHESDRIRALDPHTLARAES
jgi:hypothetical protein